MLKYTTLNVERGTRKRSRILRSTFYIRRSGCVFQQPVSATADLTASTGADIALSQVASFLLMDRSASQLGGTMDELRLGTSWGDVTGVVAAPEPSTLALGGFGALALVSLYRARRR